MNVNKLSDHQLLELLKYIHSRQEEIRILIDEKTNQGVFNKTPPTQWNPTITDPFENKMALSATIACCEFFDSLKNESC